MTTTKTKPGLSKAERAELNALKDRKLDTYVGTNVIRHFFEEKADAERFLALIIKDGAERPVFYGSDCDFYVHPSGWQGGGKICWEVGEG
jgi:hypothetical protein